MKKSLLSFAALAILFASCSNEDQFNGPEKPVVEGIPTTATFILNSGSTKAGTRALPGAPASDDAISNLLLVIVNAEQNIEKVLDVTGTDLTNKKVTTTVFSGDKYFFALANLKAELRNMILAYGDQENPAPLTTLLALQSGASSPTGPLTEGVFETAFANLYTGSAPVTHVVMSNGADASSKHRLEAGVVDPATENKNQITIAMKRAVSKAALKIQSKAVADGSVILADNFGYSLRNLNGSTYYIQKFAAGVSEETDNFDPTSGSNPTGLRPWDPYHDVVSNPAAHPWGNYHYSYTTTSPVSVGNTFTAPVYIPENAPKIAYGGNSTFFGIEATVSAFPAGKMVESINKIPADGSGSWNPVSNAADVTLTGGNNFFRITVPTGHVNITGFNTGISYYNDANLALDVLYKLCQLNSVTLPGDVTDLASFKNKFANDIPAEDIKAAVTPYYTVYLQNKCYYRLNIAEKDMTINLVRRNVSYQGSVSRFKSLGSPSWSEIEDPDKEVDKGQTNVEATITILAWDEFEFGGEI